MKPTFDIKKARNKMEEKDIDVLLASSAENFYYTSGVYDPTIFVLLKSGLVDMYTIIPREEAKEPTLVVNNAAAENAINMSWIRDIRTSATGIYLERPQKIEVFTEDAVDGIARILDEKGIVDGNIGIEERAITLYNYTRLKRKLPRAKFEDASGIFKDLRSVKSEDEIRKIKRATKITEKGYETVMESIEEGVTELQLVKKFKQVVIGEGGDVAHINMGAGPRGGNVFSSPSDYRMKRGDVIRFDAGAMYVGYRSDLCRDAVIGKPSERLEKLYKALLRGQRKVVNALKPGIKLSDVFRIGVREVRKDYPQYMRHMIGHGVGLETEEDPFITPTNNRLLEPKMVFSIEVPFYGVGWAGINIEDVVVVTEDGYEEVSTIERELRIIE